MDLLPVEYAALLTRKSDIDRGEAQFNKMHILVNQLFSSTKSWKLFPSVNLMTVLK
jgi:hypothetical protein